MRLTIEQLLVPGEAETLYPMYLAAFHPLVTQAAARHVLTAEEFGEEMSDPRIDKLLVRDDDGQVVGITTMTRELSAVPWVNPGYYRAQFPDAWARDAVFYVGYVLVDPAQRHTDALALMAEAVNGRLFEASGVLAFDICAFNDAYGVGRRLAAMFHQARSIAVVDTQTYYGADYRTSPHDQVDPGEPTPPDAGEDSAESTLAERPELADRLGSLLAGLRIAAPRVPSDESEEGRAESVLARVPGTQVVVTEVSGRLRGAAVWLPLAWDGTPEDLPVNWLDAWERGLQGMAAPQGASAAVVLPLLPDVDLASAECSAQLVAAVRRAAAAAGLGRALLLARPVLKRRYPMVVLHDYLTWQTPDGALFDTGLRLHADLGAVVAGPASGLVVVAPRTRWEEVLAMPVPADGTYVVDGGLAPLFVQHGLGHYREPRVWMGYEDLCAAQSSQIAVT